MPTAVNRKFVEWLQDWKDQAQNNTNQQYALVKAINNLRKVDRALSPYELSKEVKGIGANFQSFLVRKTDAHLKDGGTLAELYQSDIVPQYIPNSELAQKAGKKSKPPVDETLEALTELRPIKIIATKKNYRPKYRSGGYGLLMALHEHGTSNKADLLTRAQQYCDASFTIQEVGKYSAWNSMAQLIKKDLVVKTGNPAKYSLTLEGSNVAEELWKQTENFDDPLSGEGSAVATVASKPVVVPRVSILPFQYWYLNMHGRRVVEKREAQKKVQQSDKVWYQIEYHHSQSHHAFAASNIKRESTFPDASGLLLGYIDGRLAMDECPGISAQTEALNKQVAPYQKVKPSQPASVVSAVDVLQAPSASQSFVQAKRPPVQPVVTFQDIPLSERRLWPTEPEWKDQLQIPWTEPPIRFAQGSFDVVMLLDHREIRAHANRDYFCDSLKDRGVGVEVRNLELGDVMWVARSHLTKQEIVLDMVVERKRLDDLVSSIKDGRFKEQKSRLRKCALKKMWYLVEEYQSQAVQDFNKLAIRAAIVETFLLDNIQCKRTNHIDDTIEFLKLLHQHVNKIYQFQDIYAIPAGLIQSSNFQQFKHQCEVQDKRQYHFMYSEFAELNSKSKTSTLKDVWFKQLMTIRGLSVEKANIIVQQFPTMHKFMTKLQNIGTSKQDRIYNLRQHFAVDPRQVINAAVCAKLVELFCSGD